MSTRFVFPCRVVADTEPQAVAEVVALLQRKGYLPMADPKPYPCPVQPFPGEKRYEAYVEVMAP